MKGKKKRLYGEESNQKYLTQPLVAQTNLGTFNIEHRHFNVHELF